KRVFLVILFTSFSGSLVSRIPGAVHCTQGKNTQQQRMDLKTTKSEGKRINKTPETHPDNANQTCSLTTSLNRGCEMTR
ncbi:hypothetical protein AB7227_28005, partial [Escherichia coli]